MKKIKIFAFVGILTFILISFSVPSTIFVPAQETGSSADPLLIGTTSYGYDLDPQNAWDTGSYDIIHQVSEGLYAYDLGDQYLRTVPRLAADCGTWSEDHLEFTVTLREGVTFHNGNPFNAAAVKSSFDRLNYLIQIGELQTTEVYKPLNGELIINETIVIDDYTVKFVLNYIFTPFLPLLCFTGSMIVDTSVMPADTILSPIDETLVGTGPYLYKGNDGEEVQFEYFPDYYLGTPAVKKFTFVKYDSTASISQALLSGEIHMGNHDPDCLISFLGSDKITVEKPKPCSIITYMEMDNDLVNKTMRQALSFAIDYKYIIGHIYRNLIERMTSVVPPGIAFHQPQDVAILNISKARQILVEAGIAQQHGLNEMSSEEEWSDLAISNNPILSLKFFYFTPNEFKEGIGELLKLNLRSIGINITMDPWTHIEFMTYVSINWRYPEIDLAIMGWMPDYNDPSNYINSLLSNTSSSLFTGAQFNDPWLQENMMEGLTEFNETARAQIYYDIQEYIATDLMPWVFIGFSNVVSVHSTHVTDIQINAMGYLYIFPLTWYGEEAKISDEFFQYCNNCGAPPEVTDKILGYNFIVMLGVISATVISIIKKTQKKSWLR